MKAVLFNVLGELTLEVADRICRLSRFVAGGDSEAQIAIFVFIKYEITTPI